MRYFITIFLIFSYLNSFALTERDMALIEEFNLLGSGDFSHSEKDWDVDPSLVDSDKIVFKNQKRELRDWSKLDSTSWMDLKVWKEERARKDREADWKEQLRNVQHTERIARLIKCIGVCLQYKSLDFYRVRRGSFLEEGDEFETLESSYAWLLMADGALVRVSPSTSIDFGEINFSKSESQAVLRLNTGHFYYEPRWNGKYAVEDKPETDQMFYPIMSKEANREFFSIQEYRGLSTKDKLIYEVVENPGFLSQGERLNTLLEKKLFRDSKLLVYSENGHYVSKNSIVQYAHHVGGETIFQYKTDQENFVSDDKDKDFFLKVYFRGYLNKNVVEVEPNTTYEMSMLGDKLLPREKEMTLFKVVRSLAKRVVTLRLQREYLLEEIFSFHFDKKLSAKDLAAKYGYRMWDVEQKFELVDRMGFLNEYIRRLETSNLKIVQRLAKKDKVWDQTYYTDAIREHFKRIKLIHSEKFKVIRELSDSQYYLWLLKYAKI